MKFIQISSATLLNNAQTQANWILHALDSDGRIWELDDVHGWREVPLPIPAPETPVAHSKSQQKRLEVQMGGNTGHGHVRPRPDGLKAKCGGPGICSECAREAAQNRGSVTWKRSTN